MKISNYVDVLMTAIESFKQLTKINPSTKECMVYYFTQMDRINACPESTKILDGVQLSEVPVIEELKDLVFPDSVKIIAGWSARDFLVRETEVSKEPLNLMKMREAVNVFYSNFKVKSLPEAYVNRKSVILSEESVAKGMSFNGLCAGDDAKKGFPYPLCVKVYRDSSYVYSVDEVLERYFTEVCLNVRNSAGK